MGTPEEMRANEDDLALTIEAREERDRLRIVLGGELDLMGRRDLLDAVEALPIEGRPLALDLSRLAFMDSTGCRALLEVSAAARERAASSYVVIAADTGPIARLMELTGLAGALPIEWVGAS